MFWTLPGARRFLDRVVNALSDGQHVILRLPKHVVDQDPIESLNRRLAEVNLGSITSWVVSEDQEPERALAQALGFEDEDAPLDTLLSCQTPPSNFIAFLNLPNEEGRYRREWQRLLARAGALAQSREGPQPFLIIALASPRTPIPSENVKLARFPWWGVLSQIDIDQVVEEKLRANPPERSADHYWLRALCRGLAGSQPRIAHELLDRNPKTVKEVLDLLRPRELIGGNEEESLEIPQYKKKFSFLGEAMSPPPTQPDRLRLWDDGWLDWEPEYGMRLNVYALAHRDQAEKIERRLWQGQSKILLPLVEQVRHLIVGKLRKKFGDDWSHEIISKIERAEREALETEIGPLAYHLRRSTKHVKNAALQHTLRDLANVAERWRDLRNELAHVKVVEHEALLSALEAARTLIRD
ncbi:hypothetical protein KKF91_12170 [Myxococcota bacterium]|nr:hypothetical protein [Myxococcota bacterium]MBU1431287.1 hypothetical protein [Myxococcota bacterium]MBU1900449.1 hypothetical protein [Myxococcota bacterium]